MKSDDFINKKQNYKPSPISGLDLIDMTPDYTKTFEENWEEYRKRYYEVYGIWFPTYEEAKKEMNA